MRFLGSILEKWVGGLISLLVLVTTIWGLQETNRCPGKLGGFYDYYDFVVRLSISQEVGQRVETKMVLKNADILKIVENGL